MQQHLVPDRSGPSSGPTLPVFPYDGAAEPSAWPDAPGADDCPACGAPATNVQGLLDCTDCDWRQRSRTRTAAD